MIVMHYIKLIWNKELINYYYDTVSDYPSTQVHYLNSYCFEVLRYTTRCMLGTWAELTCDDVGPPILIEHWTIMVYNQSRSNIGPESRGPARKIEVQTVTLWTSGPNEKRRVMGNFSGRLERVTSTDDDEVRGGLLRRQRSRRRQSILALGRNLTLASSLCHSGGTQWESAYSRVYVLQRKEMCILFLMTTHSPTQQLLYSPLAAVTRFTLSWPYSVSCSPIYSSVCYGFRSKKLVAFPILPENRVKLSQFCVTFLAFSFKSVLQLK